MANLSPAAQAVIHASAVEACLAEWGPVNDPPCHPDDEGWNGCHLCVKRDLIAAALRAAADQVAPEDLRECQAFTNEAIRLNIQEVRRRLLAIAAELEAT